MFVLYDGLVRITFTNTACGHEESRILLVEALRFWRRDRSSFENRNTTTLEISTNVALNLSSCRYYAMPAFYVDTIDT